MENEPRAMTTLSPEHFGTGAFFFATALLEGLVKKGVLNRGEAQAIVGDALAKVRASEHPSIVGAADLFMYFYGAGQSYQTD